jgi:phosphoadenosine phosphosulfate reductase
MTTTIPPIDTAHLRGLPDEERDAVIATVSAALEGASAKDIAAWAVRSFGRDLIVAASMQDTILPHLFSAELPGVEVLFLETGYHFAETLQTRAVV